MDSSSLKAPTGYRISPTMALKRCIEEEIAKFTVDGSSTIDGHLFVHRHNDKHEYVLGSIFRAAPAQLPPLYPRVEDHFLFYEGGLDWENWRMNRPHRCWPTLRAEWEDCFERVVFIREFVL
mgnify:CR=1 FL=1